MRAHASVACCALIGLACGSSNVPVSPPKAPEPTPGASAAPAAMPTVARTLESVGLDGTALDRKVDPCKDFYAFACGGWLAKAEIPADKAMWDRSFSEIYERNLADLRKILEESGTAKNDDPARSKIGAYYAACMDEDAVERAGVKPLESDLALIRKVHDARSLSTAIIAMHKTARWALFDVSAAPDFKDATRMIAYLDQNGLGLPDRDYYLNDDDKSKEIRDKYLAHVGRMLKLAAWPSTRAAGDVMSIETEIAKVSKTRVERRDPQGLYNKIDRAGIAKTAPNFPWNDYFKALGYPDIHDVNVTSIPFFEGINRLIAHAKPAEWQSYLAWQLIHHSAPFLSKAFVDENFAMEQILSGQKELPARWKRCVDSTDQALPELLGQPYVAERFGGDSKEAAEKMVAAIKRQFGLVLGELDWMDVKTRERAADKLGAMAFLIGYPNKWKTYDFAIDKKSYADNVFTSNAFELRRDLGKVGKPVDRQEWQLSPPTVNAYYSPMRNQMVFPAGILQPPFYNAKSAIPVNTGAIGMVVGHELTHGFDDQGSKFAGDGNLTDWWDPATAENFKSKTQCVADQYAAYEPLPGVKLDGKLTLGENVADGGGVMLAFRAYRELRKEAKEQYVADGFTEDQQFFLSLGQAWCSKRTPEVTRMLARINPHSPPEFRVNGSLVDFPEFARAFSCAEGTPMHPAKSCQVW